jgi:hypothetical protein
MSGHLRELPCAQASGLSWGTQGSGLRSFCVRQCRETAFVALSSQTGSCRSASTTSVGKYFTELGAGFPSGSRSFAATRTGMSWAWKPRTRAAHSALSLPGRRVTVSGSNALPRVICPSGCIRCLLLWFVYGSHVCGVIPQVARGCPGSLATTPDRTQIKANGSGPFVQNFPRANWPRPIPSSTNLPSASPPPRVGGCDPESNHGHAGTTFGISCSVSIGFLRIAF